MTRRLAVAAAAVAIALGALAPATVSAQNLKKVVMSTPSKTIAFVPVMLAIDRGYFRDEGLDVEFRQMTPNIVVAAAISGDAPLAGTLGSSIRSNLAGGSDMQVLMIYFKDLFFTAVGGKGINTLTDLKGKTVMVNGGINATGGQSLVAMMKSVGIDARREMIVISTAGHDVGVQGLMSGAVQGAVLTPPFTQFAAAKGMKRLKEASDVLQEPSAGMTAPKSWADGNRDTVRKVIKGILRANEYILANPKETIVWMQANQKVDPDIAADMYNDIPGSIARNGKVDKSLMMDYLQRLKETSKATREINYDALVDFSIVDEALAELKQK